MGPPIRRQRFTDGYLILGELAVLVPSRVPFIARFGLDNFSFNCHGFPSRLMSSQFWTPGPAKKTANVLPNGNRPQRYRRRAYLTTGRTRIPMASSVWKGHITFGLITIPVRLLRAARSERVPLRELFPASGHLPENDEEHGQADAEQSSQLSRGKGLVRIDRKATDSAPPPEPVYEPVRRARVGQSSDDRIPLRGLTKGFEYEQGRYVTIGPDELRAITPATSAEMEITEFVHLNEIDPVYFEVSYYVRPEDAGRKPYALLYQAMREAGFAAVAQFAMHRRDRIAIVRPGPVGLIAHTMYFASEVRSDQEVRAETSLVSAKEIGLAKTLVGALAGAFDPSKYRDQYRERLEALIAAKMEGRETAIIAKPNRAAPAADIMQALHKSLEAVKRPPAKAESPVRRPSRRTGAK
jgi:DNA end-binding protein Ku